MIKVLFLRGSGAAIGGRKYETLRQESDFEVLAPELPFPAWRPRSVAEHFKWGGEAVVQAVLEPARTAAQEAADQFKPDVIVGSSMGGVLAIGVGSEAARVLIAPAVEFAVPGITLPNPLASRRLPVRSVILHAEEDGVVPFAASLRLLEQAAKSAGAADAATMSLIQDDLRKAGYSTRHGRLIRIGCDHQCNDPHPDDTWNADPRPHAAMIQAVRIMSLIRPSHEAAAG